MHVLALVFAFDDGNIKKNQVNAYVIYYESRYWKIAPVVYQIFLCIQESKTLEQIKAQMLDTYSVDIEEDKLKHIIEVAFVQTGLLQGTVLKTKRKRNKNLWGKVTLLPTEIVMKFKFLTIFYKKRILFFLGSLSLVWLVYILNSFSNRTIMEQMSRLSLINIVYCYIFIMISGIIHEFGHAMAATYCESNPGRIGFGVYIIMPVMFSEVTDVWRLERKKRVLVDLGGIYFQGFFLMFCYFLNFTFFHHNLWNIAILVSTFQIIGNLNPFIKLDGYWILADYLGTAEIKDSVKRTWKSLFVNTDKKKEVISKDKRIVIYVYSLFTVCFYVMFLRMLINSFAVAVQYCCSDIAQIPYIINNTQLITVGNVASYLASRLVSVITILFLSEFC